MTSVNRQARHWKGSHCTRLCLLLAALPQAVWAQSSAEAPASPVRPGQVFNLGTVAVTGSKAQLGDMPQELIGSALSGQDIQRFGKETVGDAVNLLPGVSLSGNSRNELMVSVRGFDARQVPLFIDGVPVYVPYDGYVDFARFSTADIAGIQLVKGFSSISYGPNALGGAINIVSRRPSRAAEGDVFAGVGTGGERKVGLNVGTRQGDWYLQGSLASREADGFRLSKDFQPTPTEDGGLRDNSDRRDRKRSFKVGWTPRASDEYALSYYKQEGRKGQPPTTLSSGVRYWRWPYWDKESLYFVSRSALTAHETLKLRVYEDRFENEVDSFTDASYSKLKTSGQGSVSTGRSIYHDRSRGAAVELESQRLDAHQLRAVLQYKKDRHEEVDGNAVRGALFEDSLQTLGIEDLWTLAPGWDLALGLARHELKPASVYSASSAYGLPQASKANNAQLGLFHALGAGQRVYASLSSKTRLPTLKDRYSQRLGSYVENPALGPERSLNAELGWQWKPAEASQLDLALFSSEADDRIQSVFVKGGSSCSAATPCQMRNVGKTRVQGVEASAKTSLAAWLDVGGNLTVMEQKNLSDPATRLTNSPNGKLFAWATARVGRGVELQASVEHAGQRWVSNTAAVGAYTVVGLRARWTPLRALRLELGVENIGDKLYEQDLGFPAPGRTWTLNARHEF